MTVLYSNDFESDSTGAAPAGWYGVSKVQAGNSGATVSGTKAMLAYGEESGSRSEYRGIAARTQVDYRFKQKAQFNGASLLLQSFIHGDDQENDGQIRNAYFLGITAASASSVSVGLKRDISTIWDETAVATGSHSWTVSAGDVICQRLVVDGTNIKHYVWNESNESEPSTPTLSYTDTTQRPAGYLYISYNNGGGAVATGFDDVVISDISAGGASASFTITSDDATFGGGATVSPMTSFMVTAESSVFAGAASIGTAEAEFAVATENSTFYGGAVGYAAQGTITTPALKNNTGTILANESGITAYVYNPVTGALIVKLTGQTTNGLGVMTLTDAAIVSGTQYRVVIVLSSGDEGMEKLTAS